MNTLTLIKVFGITEPTAVNSVRSSGMNRMVWKDVILQNIILDPARALCALI